MADNPRQEVLEILQDIKLPGSFSTGGTCEASLNTPGIEVDGVGVLGLPLCDAQAQRVRARCEQAHFGKGSKAVVDKTVRNMFQLAPEHFKITNPTWGSDLAALVSQVCRELGVQSHLKVQAQLYKMLWYEEGSFFTMHCDSKKVDGMLATLVVTLPSVYSGGELVVQHQGKEKIFPPSQMSAFLSHYASFYADCKYELKPVTLGHQLCLVYNLVKTGDGQFPDAQQGCDVIKRLKSAAANWGEDFDGSKLVIMTEHQYTPYGLKCSSGSVKFKGYDAEIVDALEIAIKEGVDLDWDHGTVSYSESGCAKSGGCCGGYEWYKTTDSFVSLALSSWGQVGIRKKEIEPEDYWEDKDAVNKNFELIGNEGVKAERQYYDAEAIVVWPRSQQWVVVTNNNVDKMTSFLLKACTPDTEGSESKEECIQKAQSVADKIAWARAYSVDLSCSKANSQRNVSMLLKALIQLGDQAIALKVLSQYITANTTVTPDLILEELLPFIDCFGVDSVQPCIMATVDGKYSCTDPTTASQFVIQLCNQLLKDKDVRNYTSLATDLIIGFIDRLAPNNKNDNWSPQKSLDNFPLADVLRMFHGNDAVVPNGGSLVKRVIDYLIWASCQPLPVQSTGPCTGSSKPRGPMVLLQCTTELVDTLDTLPQGWNDFASILTDAVNALCKLKSVDAAIRLVEALAPQGPNILDSDQGQACKDMALIVCEYVLKFSATNKTINAQSVLIAYKKLF